MNDFKALYRETFSYIKASPALRKELLSMTEKTKRSKKFVLRRLLVAAAVLALVFALAMGANAATNGALFEFIGMASVEVDGGSQDVYMYHGKSESGMDTYVFTLDDGNAYRVEQDGADSSDTEETYTEVETDDGGRFAYTVKAQGEVSSIPEE